VLVGVDQDTLVEDVLATLRWCVRLGAGDQITVLHATPIYPWMRRGVESDPEWVASAQAEEGKAERLLSTSERLLSSWGISAETVRVEGHAAEAILRVAAERQVDLIVVGALGQEERGFLVGSVSQKVKALALTDVLVVRRGAPLQASPLRALLAVDGSTHSLAAAEALATKVRWEGAQVHIVHALDVPMLSMWELLAGVEEVDPASLPPPLRERAGQALSGPLRILHAHGIEATTEIRTGRPAVEILEAARRHQAHLIVVGSRGLSGIRGLLLGSVTQRVVRHGTTSVLVARGPHRADGRSES